MLSISALSTEYVRVQISATNAGATVDPTADVVTLAFVAPGAQPASADWKAASWESDATTIPTTYYARALVGPGTGGVITLTAGQVYDCFTKITDTGEVPVKYAGSLRAL